VKTAVQSSCPLCGKASLRPNLHARINSEHETIRQATIEVIQSSHPAWVPKDGMCECCWNSYRDVSRVIHFFREFRRRNIRATGGAIHILSGAANGMDRDDGGLQPAHMHRQAMAAGGGGA
jgi:hypothetical protein